MGIAVSRDDSEDAVLARTAHVWPDIREALMDGIKAAVDLHDFIGWDYRDDKHLYQHMIRRKAVEAFKVLKPEGETGSEPVDATDLPMSGLILTLEHDVVRIWHIATPEIPKPTTPTKCEFVSQPPSRQMSLFDVPDVGRKHELNHLILRWTVREHLIERFDLVRPAGMEKNHVVVDWHRNLLPRCAPPPETAG
ncbi:hypothetical protein [Nonomuraea sp. NPDC049129]|uniref:hypothetical protein n=1 Tax=Nonomuraea sp. NPDC049129 TaxID=3155272 RepID=UPI0033FCC42C